MREYCVLLSVLVLTGSTGTTGADNIHVDVSPRISHIHASHPSAVVCRLRDEHNHSVPLSHCQFNWENRNHVDIHKDTIDFSAGHKSKIQHEIEYHGNGLEHGECGFKLRGGYFKKDTTRVYECRVMATNQRGWHYGSHMVQVTGYEDMDFQLYPKEAVVLEGGGIDISGVADRELAGCHVFTLLSYIYLSDGPDSHHPNPEVDANHRYFGSGLQNKACGVSLRNVTSAMNGYIAAQVTDVGNVHLHKDITRLIVATAPDRPKLQLRHFDSTSVETTAEFEAGDIVRATCTVANSRPVSNLTWLLGDDVVRQDTEDESQDNEDKWWWSYDPQNITQDWFHTLSMADDGKDLTCRAEHVALPSGTISTSIRITVKPRPIRFWIWFLAVLLVLVGAVGVAAIVLYAGGRFFTAKTGTRVQFRNTNENADNALKFENVVDFDTSD